MNKIRNLFLLACTAVAAFVAAPPVEAAPAARWPHQLGIGGADGSTETFAGKSANLSVSGTVSSNLAYFITSDQPAGQARLTYLNFTTDIGTVQPLTFYNTTNSVTVLTNQAASTNRFTVASTATLATNDFLVYRGSNDTYQLLVVSNIDSATVFATYQATTNALNIGDKFYEMQSVSTIAVANASGGSTTEKSIPQGIFHGQQGKPFLITVGGSNATPSLLVSGEYFRRLRP